MILDRSAVKTARRQKSEARERWHSWYAWRPVETPYDSGRWVWLHTIERRWYSTVEHWVEGAGLFGGRGSTGSTGWEYRLHDR